MISGFIFVIATAIISLYVLINERAREFVLRKLNLNKNKAELKNETN
jgi:hypothetical protein